jgi:hypothetical protein
MHKPTIIQRLRRFRHPLRRAQLKSEIREILPAAIKAGPRSFAWLVATNRSLELREGYGE